MVQKMIALKFFAAIEIALPSLSSLVASCKISETSPTQALKIKIQTNILPSLHQQTSTTISSIHGQKETFPLLGNARPRRGLSLIPR
jgi:hypothetical protein